MCTKCLASLDWLAARTSQREGEERGIERGTGRRGAGDRSKRRVENNGGIRRERRLEQCGGDGRKG